MNDREYRVAIAALLTAGYADVIFGEMISDPAIATVVGESVPFAEDDRLVVPVSFGQLTRIGAPFGERLLAKLAGKTVPGFADLAELKAFLDEVDDPLFDLAAAGLLPPS